MPDSWTWCRVNSQDKDIVPGFVAALAEHGLVLLDAVTSRNDLLRLALPVGIEEQQGRRRGLVRLVDVEVQAGRRELCRRGRGRLVPAWFQEPGTGSGGADATKPAPAGSTTAPDYAVTSKHNPASKCGCRTRVRSG